MRERVGRYLASEAFCKVKREGAIWLIVFGLTALILSIGSYVNHNRSSTTSAPPLGRLEGTVVFDPGTMIPQEARLLIQLIDPTAESQAEMVISESITEQSDITSPLSFALQYDPDWVRQGKKIMVSARIESDHRTFFETPEWVEAKPGRRLELSLGEVLSQKEKGRFLERKLCDQDWRLTHLEQEPLSASEIFHLHFNHLDRVTIATPCRRLNGRYRTSEGVLKVLDFIANPSPCREDVMDLEERLKFSLALSDRTELHGNVLRLFREGSEVARLVPLEDR